MYIKTLFVAALFATIAALTVLLPNDYAFAGGEEQQVTAEDDLKSPRQLLGNWMWKTSGSPARLSIDRVESDGDIIGYYERGTFSIDVMGTSKWDGSTQLVDLDVGDATLSLRLFGPGMLVGDFVFRGSSSRAVFRKQ